MKRLAMAASAFLAIAGLAAFTMLGDIEAEVITITTAATELKPAAYGGRSPSSCRIWNNSATVAYVGGSGVDTTDGYPLCTDTASCPEAAITIDGNGVYALVASSTLDLNVICGR